MKNIFLILITACAIFQSSSDPYMWLEEIDASKSLDWVREKNASSLEALTGTVRYQQNFEYINQVLNDQKKLIEGDIYQSDILNFWQDEKHVRGLWRRIKITNFKKSIFNYENLIDLDQLAKEENRNWVWHGANCLERYSRCLVFLSDGGTDAHSMREYDLIAKRFVKSGFNMPEAKSWSSWVSRDQLLVATYLNKNEQTTSGYPQKLRLWQRGQKLEQAETVFQVESDAVGAIPLVFNHRDQQLIIFQNWKSFFASEYYLWDGKNSKKMSLPDHIKIYGLFQDNLIVENRKDWGKFKQGSLLAIPTSQLSQPKLLSQVVGVWQPTRTSILSHVAITKNQILINTLEDVKARLYALKKIAKSWRLQRIYHLKNGSISFSGFSPYHEDVFIRYQDFLTPNKLYSLSGVSLKPLQSLTSQFDEKKFSVNQYFSTSVDGEKIPYFVISAKNLKRNSLNPTILYGYGGFEIALTPFYLSYMGKIWLEQGGVYVIANIRGGGEYGPRWHQAALQDKRHLAYEDFESIAKDLVKKSITSPSLLGIAGGSNGGLLVGATMVRKPELYGAVFCAVPLLDMLRYHQLLAGASWVGEYGSPDDEKMRNYLANYSPYQQVQATQKYPSVFFLTSTKDDRVHPGHARKMAAKMMDQGHNVLYYENIEGGHGAAANLEQKAMSIALRFEYFHQTLKLKH